MQFRIRAAVQIAANTLNRRLAGLLMQGYNVMQKSILRIWIVAIGTERKTNGFVRVSQVTDGL